MKTIKELASCYTFEQLAAALYQKGLNEGYTKVTDKTKWREPVMAEKLGHTAFPKISAGKASAKYGADAEDPRSGRMVEYKTKAIEEKELPNLLRRRKSKSGSCYEPLTVLGVYNGAYTTESIDAYAKHDHYFGVFYREQCVLIIRPKTDVVIAQLRSNLRRKLAKGGKATTNLNTVRIKLDGSGDYSVAYRDGEFFKDSQ